MWKQLLCRQMQVMMAQCYNERLVLERNSNSTSLTVMFSDLVTPSMDGESNILNATVRGQSYTLVVAQSHLSIIVTYQYCRKSTFPVR